MYTDEIISEEETEAAETTAAEKLIRVFLIIACAAAAFVLVWLVGITPFRPFSQISITPIEGLSREEILASSLLSTRSSFATADSRAMEKALMTVPQIQSAKVYKRFPGSLEIILEGRKAVAVSVVRVGEINMPVYFDASGVIFRIGSSSGAPVLPVISGMLIENPYPGMKLPLTYTSLFAQIEALYTSAPGLLFAISEIEINRKEESGFDLIIYPVYPRVKVRLSELNEDLLKYALLTVDVLAARDSQIDYIDFRSGVASYTAGNK